MKNKILIFIISFLSIFLCLLGPSQVVWAATSSSVITKVGNPKGPAPNSGDLAAAAQDLVNAYRSCGSSLTYPSDVDSKCFSSTLLGDGFSQDSVNQVANLSNYISSDGCVECIGFVRQSVILAFGGEDPRLTSANGNTPVLQKWQTMSFNGHVYQNLGNTVPQAGDIAVTLGNAQEKVGTDFGHIDVVKSVRNVGQDIEFTGLDANWSYIDGQLYPHPSCRVSDDVEHPAQYYVFYRQQS